MSTLHPWVTSSLLLLLVSWRLGAAVDPMWPQAKRVVFLGDSITHAGQYLDYIAAYFATRFPAREIELLNLGLPSETVSGLSEEGHAGGKFPRPNLHERLTRVLDQSKPDTVVANYGMNDGIYLPFSVERFSAFTNGILRLRELVLARGARIIHVTPPVFDEVKGQAPGYGEALARYAEWLRQQRTNGWEVIDVHSPMTRVLTERRRSEPNFYLAGDGVHPGEDGHWIMAKAILLHLGAKDLAQTYDAREMVKANPQGSKILKLIQQKQVLLRDAWLSATGHQRPGMNKGLPVAQAESKAAELDKELRAVTAPRNEP